MCIVGLRCGWLVRVGGGLVVVCLVVRLLIVCWWCVV